MSPKQGFIKASIIYPHLSTFIHIAALLMHMLLIYRYLCIDKKTKFVDNALQINKLI